MNKLDLEIISDIERYLLNQIKYGSSDGEEYYKEIYEKIQELKGEQLW